ncbi:MAG: hypothetical protein ACYCS7_03900 [Acidimicrobiales bacterium]
MYRVPYQYEALSVSGFVQQLVNYVANSYLFYVRGQIPHSRNLERVDADILDRYDIRTSKWMRARRKLAGRANLQYLRYNRDFVIISTHGPHPFRVAEADAIRDATETPIKVFGYSVSSKGGHAVTRIEVERYRELKAYFSEVATKRSVRVLFEEFRSLGFESYAGVRTQLIGLVKEVNRLRGAAGMAPLPFTAVRFRRRIVRPFEPLPVEDDPVRSGLLDAADVEDVPDLDAVGE